MPTSIAVLDANSASQTIATNDAIVAQIGEVQASPTSNTLLDRLKTLHADLIAATPAGTSLIGKVGIDQTTPGTTNAVAVLTQIGAANLANNQVTVDTTSGGVTIAASRATRRSVTVVNHGATAVYLGTGTVSAANGVLLAGVAGASVTFEVTPAIKGITAGGSATVGYFEEYD